jgi:hypothetical protein
MKKKDYNLIADVLNQFVGSSLEVADKPGLHALFHALAEAFQATNPSFDYHKFQEAVMRGAEFEPGNNIGIRAVLIETYNPDYEDGPWAWHGIYRMRRQTPHATSYAMDDTDLEEVKQYKKEAYRESMCYDDQDEEEREIIDNNYLEDTRATIVYV